MIAKIEQAYNKTRQELCDLGLLDDGVYLDAIELSPVGKLAALMSGAHGWVYDHKVDFWSKLVGFKDGVIYIATDNKTAGLKGAYSMTDVVRHEFAHAWYWLDPKFIDGPWFRKAFGCPYHSDPCPFGSEVWSVFENHPEEFKRSGYANDYVSPYAMYSSYEDFAETFQFYLRNRNSLTRFKSRTGVYKKLTAVQTAVARKAKKLGLV